MARIRTIKPEFPQSESMGRVSRNARLLFIMLWTIADDSGRARAASRMLASLLFPYDEDAATLLPTWLTELEREHCIKHYSVDGNAYLQIEKWTAHQKIDKPSSSKLPSPPVRSSREKSRSVKNVREGHRQYREGSSEDLVPRTLDLGPSISAIPALRRISKNLLNGHEKDFAEFYAVFPKHVARAQAQKAYAKALERAAPAVILDGARRYRRSREGEEQRFTKNPGTWLNADCWLDEPPLSEGSAPNPDMAAAIEAEREHRRKHGEIE